jgi:Protein of unknown function (DUF1236)
MVHVLRKRGTMTQEAVTRNRILPAIALALGLMGAAVASAQDAPRDTGAAGPLPGLNASPPQATDHAAEASNTMQPVPGAMPGSEAVPSTISEKNAADDKLITVAYTFKNLTDEQRQAIFEALTGQPAGRAFKADIGTVVPFGVELHEMPGDVTRQVPQTKGYQYAVADSRVVLVSPPTRIAVAVLTDVGATTGQGGRSPNR